MCEKESESWTRLVAARNKCLALTTATAAAAAGVATYEELAEIQNLLSDLWFRLETNTRKGAPPLPHAATMARRYVDQVVIPLTTAWCICEASARNEEDDDDECGST